MGIILYFLFCRVALQHVKSSFALLLYPAIKVSCVSSAVEWYILYPFRQFTYVNSTPPQLCIKRTHEVERQRGEWWSMMHLNMERIKITQLGYLGNVFCILLLFSILLIPYCSNGRLQWTLRLNQSTDVMI